MTCKKCKGTGEYTKTVYPNSHVKVPCDQPECAERRKAQMEIERQAVLDTRMTPEQIKNFRGPLSLSIGPYAFLAPDEEIQAIRDAMQRKIYSIEYGAHS